MVWEPALGQGCYRRQRHTFLIRKSEKARQVATVPDSGGELAMEMLQWLVRRGLLMRLGPPVEHSAKLASGLGAVDHDDL